MWESSCGYCLQEARMATKWEVQWQGGLGATVTRDLSEASGWRWGDSGSGCLLWAVTFASQGAGPTEGNCQGEAKGGSEPLNPSLC